MACGKYLYEIWKEAKQHNNISNTQQNNDNHCFTKSNQQSLNENTQTNNGITKRKIQKLK